MLSISKNNYFVLRSSVASGKMKESYYAIRSRGGWMFE